MATKEEIRELKRAWRLITNYQSDPPWYTFLKALRDNNLFTEVHSENLRMVQKFARVHREIPKTGVPLSQSITYYLSIEKTISDMNGRRMLGLELQDLIQKQGIPLPPATRSDWFSHIGGFNKKRLYEPDQVSYILFRCSVYLGKKNRNVSK